jgi:hypothetical protein
MRMLRKVTTLLGYAGVMNSWAIASPRRGSAWRARLRASPTRPSGEQDERSLDGVRRSRRAIPLARDRFRSPDDSRFVCVECLVG